MKKIVTMNNIELALADMFPGQEIFKLSISSFSSVTFTLNKEQVVREFCVLFKFKYSNVQYCWDVAANVVFANLQDLTFDRLEPGTKKVIGNKSYRVFREDGKFCAEIKDCPKLKSKIDALKVWKKIHKDYDEEFKGFFFPELIHSMVNGEDGWLVAMKNDGDGYRDILFIRAQDGADIRIRHAARNVHYTYLEKPSLELTGYLEPKPKKR